MLQELLSLKNKLFDSTLLPKYCWVSLLPLIAQCLVRVAHNHLSFAHHPTSLEHAPDKLLSPALC